MFIKFFTSPLFRKQEFVDMLKYQCNVRACITNDGIILDKEAFNDIKPGHLPHWAYLNRKYINSELYTRPATYDEYHELTKPRYSVVMRTKDDSTEMQESDNLDSMKEQANICACIWRNKHEVIAIHVMDNFTGEIMHEVNG